MERHVSDLPARVHIQEEGPREGFQYEKGPIPTQRKIELIDRLARTGLDHIQIVSFVNPKLVPGMADAEDVVRGIAAQPGVAYTALWLNDVGFKRALAAGTLKIEGSITLCPSAAFLKRNQNKTPQQQLEARNTPSRAYIRSMRSIAAAPASWRRSAATSKARFRPRASSNWCNNTSTSPRNTA
jgi:hydroxymethylglutaryl-CoA lyase